MDAKLHPSGVYGSRTASLARRFRDDNGRAARQFRSNTGSVCVIEALA